MTPVAAALAPVFGVIFIGYVLRKTSIIREELWGGVDALCYFVLFPALIIRTLATADLSSVPGIPIAAAMLSAICLMALLMLLARAPLSALLNLSPASYTSLFQGATRWHTFMAMAIVSSMFGESGLAVASIGIVAMIPVLNLMNVTFLTRYGAHESTTRPHPLRAILRNPFIISCAIGIAINLTQLPLPRVMLETLDIIGRAALGAALLGVGAALHPTRLFGQFPAVAATALIRLVGMPLLMVLFCTLYGVSGEPLIVATICGAVPTAGAAYTLARQLGGDAELMAAIMTFQVIAALATLPLFISWTGSLTGVN